MPTPAGFDQRVWAAVALIPPGSLATYGQIAELIGAYGCARQVGWALRRLPLPSPIPWHRVVNARGCVSMSPGREGSDWIQRDLLLAEGIPVDRHGRLPLARFRWIPPALPCSTAGALQPAAVLTGEPPAVAPTAVETTSAEPTAVEPTTAGPTAGDPFAVGHHHGPDERGSDS